MKKIIQQTLAILNSKERRLFNRLTLLNTFISIADIAFLALLVALIQIYSSKVQATNLHFAIGNSTFEIPYLLPISLFILLFILKNILAYNGLKSQYQYVYRVATRISGDNMRRYYKQHYTDYTHTDASVAINNISNQPVQFCHYVLAGAQQLFTEISVTAIAIIAILFFNAKLFLLLLVVILPPLLIAAFMIRRKLKMARTQVKDHAEKTTQHLQEAISGYVDANVFGKTDFLTRRYTDYQERLNHYLSQLQSTQIMPSRFTEVFAVIGLLLLILVNQYTDQTTMELINIGAFMAAAYKIIPGITRIASVSTQMRTYAFTLKDMPPAKDNNDTLPYNNIREPINNISFRDISFAYGNKNVLTRFNLDLQRGDFLGIASASGKGKTTLINLLLGFLKEDEGSILFNNLPLQMEERKQFWPGIAYVKQQPFLLHDSILHNITLSDDYDKIQLNKVIAATGLQPFIDHFPEGINKIITDTGKNISGGQRQRIALARALYRPADVIILDEPFSELDHESETALLHHLRSLSAEGKIIILITHNLSSLEHCSKTILVND